MTRLRSLPLLLSILLVASLAANGVQTYRLGHPATPRLTRFGGTSNAIPFTLPSPRTTAFAGIDSPDPASGLTNCTEWTWLQSSCYTNSTLNVNFDVSPQMVLQDDLTEAKSANLGTFFRLWVSLDEGMVSGWDPTTGYHGFDSGFLANVDDVLHKVAAVGDTVDLVLYTYSPAQPTNPATATVRSRPGARRTSHRALPAASMASAG